MASLENKVALVSGSGRGIGRAIALRLAKAGAKIVVNDLDSEPAEETCSLLDALGAESVPCVGNVCDSNFGERFVGTALDQFGAVDIIINNAGYTWDNVIQKMSDDQFAQILDVHLGAPFRILRAAIGHFRERAKDEALAGEKSYRKVVNISSTVGLFGNPGQANYGSAKAGLVGLTRTLCKEWGRYNVNVNCVAFGYIETRLTQIISDAPATIEIGGQDIAVGIQQTTSDMASGLIPLGRAGTPEEAAGAVYLLCTPDADYISGQVLVCSGGALL